jgi:transcriptional regulator with XRE-family HTH domain
MGGAMSASLLSNDFGQALRQLREQRGWSQEVLAEHADLNRTYVGDLERAKAVPSLQTLEKLAHAFGLSVSKLIAHVEELNAARSIRGVQLTGIAC